jgi:hypothetical protein
MWSRPIASGPHSPSDEVVHRESHAVALARPSQQMRAGRPCSGDALARELDPAAQGVRPDDVHQRVLTPAQIPRIAREADPAEGPDAAREDRAHVLRDEAGDVQRLRQAVRSGLARMPFPYSKTTAPRSR